MRESWFGGAFGLPLEARRTKDLSGGSAFDWDADRVDPSLDPSFQLRYPSSIDPTEGGDTSLSPADRNGPAPWRVPRATEVVKMGTRNVDAC